MSYLAGLQKIYYKYVMRLITHKLYTVSNQKYSKKNLRDQKN